MSAEDTPPAGRRSRTQAPERNRRAVLAAASRLFAAHGYEATSIREIAAEADVTAGSVMAYFGSKDGLFREIIGASTGITVGVDIAAAAADGPVHLSHTLASAYLERWDRTPAEHPWAALIRSAVAHEASAEQLRAILDEQVTAPLVELLAETPDAPERIALVRSVLFGVVMERYLFAHEPARSVPSEAFTPYFAEALSSALDRAHTPAADSAPDAWHTEPSGPDVSAFAVFRRLHRCSALYRAAVSRTVEEQGITLAAFDVLTELWRAGPPHRRAVGEIAESVPLSPSSVTLRADQLEEAGLVTRERDGLDRRVVHLRLTEAGQDLVDRVSRGPFAGDEEFLRIMGPAERAALARLLGLLETALSAADPA
ncbi:TetR family transcriptional regulator [Amycolatopsis rubida]|uniref:TetR family transcriptional regulator n=1 Tax=Amycolatopsis rubida TaxID=112413 RepID=A0ABX0C456_9PSEU|nr:MULTISPECIES: TetR family transcriptional regulator [Amycolatopsis]MYW97569.1 TetR family transcriptional regulator [Amycolatopsis rubida]NEC62554.1 TetR family transcriptional regulator [Amycolatopsis rubida]OAP27429.1 putative HTH-type transcriptional regulator YusO [Amycolatopsis sp. M39]